MAKARLATRDFPITTLGLHAHSPTPKLQTRNTDRQYRQNGEAESKLSPTCLALRNRANQFQLIILIRHAQSEGNKNREIHQMIPDHRVKLTDEGHKQVDRESVEVEVAYLTDAGRRSWSTASYPFET